MPIFIMVYVIEDFWGNNNSPKFLNVMVNYHYHGKNRAISR